MTDITNSHRNRAFYTGFAVLVGALALSLSAGASNTSLRVSLDAWSRTIGTDAHVVSLAAKGRQPRRMTSSALRFRHDALRARAAIGTQHPSTANGQKARTLAVAAFADYALAGSHWASVGRARVRHQRATASRNARAATRFASAGNHVLVAVARLLR